MKQILTQFITVFLGFFAIMNPIANTPIFIGLTVDEEEKVKRKIAYKAVLTAFLIVVTFSILGKIIFEMFGISLPAFRIAGGILVFIIGFHMLHGESSKVHRPRYLEESEKIDIDSELSVAITPLAMPILAGPGTISAAINYSASGNIGNVFITIITFGLLCVITYLFFIFGEKFINYIGKNAVKVITRLMGLILAVIGVQMVIEGIKDAMKIF